MTTSVLEDVARRCDAIEECYEFMLAYAAQGLTHDQESGHGALLRELMGKAAAAASGLSDAYAAAVAGLAPAERFKAFIELLSADAGKALTVLELVLAQPGISSQLIDNLNASIHLRTLLTDVFLIDEIVRARLVAASDQAGA